MRKVKRIEVEKKDKPNICGYVRVSSPSHLQENSFDAQKAEWHRRFGDDEQYNLVKVFGDLAVSGHKVKEREEFQEMVDLALRGKIDIIVTKSISRFARNVAESQKVLRQLKEADVEVRFDKENLSTRKFGTEFFIVILSIVAEFELKNMSEAVKFGYRFRMNNGSVEVPYIFGYDVGDDGSFTINEMQAVAVRRIFALYISGLGVNAVAQQMENEGFITYMGNVHWSKGTIQDILRNEKYIGDARSQKTYSDGEFRKCMNNGELPQVYITNNHEGIISREDFKRTQEIIASKRIAPTKWHEKREKYDFTSRIKCLCCGTNFKRRVNKSCRRVSPIGWICTKQFMRGKAGCESTSVTEDFLQDLLVDAFNEYLKTPYEAPMNNDDAERLAEIEAEGTWVRQVYKDGYIPYSKYAEKIDGLKEEYSAAYEKARESLKNQYYVKPQGGKADRYDSSIVDNHVERIRIGLFYAEFEFKNGQIIRRKFKYEHRKFVKQDD